MVALASDWRLTEERAQRFLSPARIVERYRQIMKSLPEQPAAAPSYGQMLRTVVAYDGLEQSPTAGERLRAE